MGVPITFLDKHNPDQFEILGDSRYGYEGNDSPNDAYYIDENGNKKTPFRRILIRNKNPQP